MDPIMTEEERAEVKKLLAALKGDVTVTLYTRRSSLVIPGEEGSPATTAETEQLLTEVSALDPHVKLTVHNAAVDPEPARKAGLEGVVPALEFRSPTGATRGTLRYLGIPAGYEFRTLLDTLIAVGNGESGLSAPSREALAKVARPVHLTVFVTPG